MKMFFATVFLFMAGISSALAHGSFHPTRYVNYQGGRIALYESGGHRGPAILLVHGNTAAADYFQRFLQTPFAQNRRVIAMDMPGYGNSSHFASYNAAFLASAVVKAAQATGADQGVIVGWSLGGDMALQASPQLPNVKGYLIVGTAPLGYTPTLPPPFLSATESYAGNAVNYGVIPNLTTQQVNDYVHAFFRPNYSPIPQSLFQISQSTDPNTRAAVFNAATGQDPTFLDEAAIVTNMTTPIAVLLGDHDAFVRPAYLQALAPMMPSLWRNQIITVQNSGHCAHWEHPVEMATIMRQFLRDL